jgi:hypothetical protein
VRKLKYGLFAFIGTFTYINFVLVRPPFMTGPMELGFVYFVSCPRSSRRRLPGAPSAASVPGQRFGVPLGWPA